MEAGWIGLFWRPRGSTRGEEQGSGNSASKVARVGYLGGASPGALTSTPPMLLPRAHPARSAKPVYVWVGEAPSIALTGS